MNRVIRACIALTTALLIAIAIAFSPETKSDVPAPQIEKQPIIVDTVELKHEIKLTDNKAHGTVGDDEIKADAEKYLASEKVVIPDDVKNLCETYGNEYNVCPELLEAMCWQESRCKPGVSNGNCKGIMQISEPCHKKRMNRIGANNLYDSADNIHTAADYMAELFDKYEDADKVLMLYNGDSRALKTGYTSKYADKILKISAALERVHGK